MSLGTFDLLVYTSATVIGSIVSPSSVSLFSMQAEVPRTWEESDPKWHDSLKFRNEFHVFVYQIYKSIQSCSPALIYNDG